MESYRNVAAIVISLTIVQAALGALSMIGPLSLAAGGAATFDIGLVATAYSAGFFLAVRFAPREIGRIGHIRAFCAFSAVAAVAASALGWTDSIFWWSVAHLLMGASAAGLFAAGESWIASSADPERRGAVLSFYFILSRLGFLAGPFLAASLPAGDARGFLLVVTLLVAALIPVAATRSSQPTVANIKPLSLLDVWSIAPAALVAALVAGLVNGAVRQLYPVFTAELDSVNVGAIAAAFNGLLYLGAIVTQWPIGALSDRLDRRLVIAVIGGISGFVSLLLAVLAPALALREVYILALIWGGTGMATYGLAVAHAGDRAEQSEIPALMSAILLIWAGGSMVGPLIASLMMQLIGAAGLFYFCALVSAGLVGAMLLRRGVAAAVPEDEKGDFAPASPTSSEAAELAPGREDELDARPS